MRKALGVLATILALVWAVSQVEACYNDEETQKQEQQFRSLYPDAPAQPAASDGQIYAYGGSGLGIALLAVAGYVGFGRRRS